MPANHLIGLNGRRVSRPTSGTRPDVSGPGRFRTDVANLASFDPLPTVFRRPYTKCGGNRCQPYRKADESPDEIFAESPIVTPGNCSSHSRWPTSCEAVGSTSARSKDVR